MPGRRGALLGLVAGSCLFACGGEGESLTGVWTGAVKDSRGGAGGATFTFSQSGSDLGGTWEVLFSATSPFNNGGTLTGTVEGSSISSRLASHGACAYLLTATRSGDRIQGTYAAVDCPLTQTGSLDLERR